MFELNVINITLLVLGALVAIFLIVLFYYLKRHWYTNRVIVPRTLDWVFLEIQMPKENTDQEDKPKNDEEKKNLIAIAEQLFTTISAAGNEDKGFLAPKEYVSFEIACTDKKISFYINCP